MIDYVPSLRRYTSRGYLVARDGLSLVFYTRLPHAQVAQDVWHALNVYLQAIGSEALPSYSDEQGERQRLDESGWKLIQQQFQQPDSCMVRLLPPMDQAHQFGFTYQGRGPNPFPWEGDGSKRVCGVLFRLPTDFLEQSGPESARNLALQLATSLPFSTGHAGLSFNGDADLLQGTPEEQELCFRYPGMDISDGELPVDMGSRVDGIHWLNFLGPPVLEELGGIEALRQRLHSPSTTVQALETGRALVTLGPYPDAGDVQQGRTLPAYRELARVLEPWLYQSSPRPAHLDELGQHIRRWERRFLEP
jgi:hypothetical protein